MYNTIEEAKKLTSAWWALQELLITKIVEAMGRQQMTRVPTEEFRTVLSLVCSSGGTLIPAFGNSWSRFSGVGEVARMKWFSPVGAKAITERVEGHNQNLKDRIERLYQEELKVGVKRRIK